MSDATITATFANPYGSNEGAWDYGFFFRQSAADYYALVVKSDGAWYFRYRPTGASAARSIAAVLSSQINTAAGASNKLSLTIRGQAATFLVNDTVVGSFTLTDITTGGGVSAISGYFSGDQKAGASTRFTGFTIAT